MKRYLLMCLVTLGIAAIYSNTAHAARDLSSRKPSATTCPCEGDKYCKGPRDGRYCVAKNGKKYYFKRTTSNKSRG
jgi:hypothetical protein